MNEFRWDEKKRNKRNNLIARLKTIYKEIGKQIKHTCEWKWEKQQRTLFALADEIIYLFSDEIIGNIFRVSPLGCL
jgi:5-methylthioribose kinase